MGGSDSVTLRIKTIGSTVTAHIFSRYTQLTVGFVFNRYTGNANKIGQNRTGSSIVKSPSCAGCAGHAARPQF